MGQLEEQVFVGTPINIEGEDKDIYYDGKNDIEFQAEMAKLIGHELTEEFTKKYSRSDFLEMLNTYSLFKFNSEPKTGEEKLERLIKFHEWKEKLDSLNWMSTNFMSITDSFEGFEKLMDRIIGSDNKDVIEYNPFISDQLMSVASRLLDYYGINPKTSLGFGDASQKSKNGHFARPDINSPKLLIPDMTTDELVNLCFDLKLKGTPARYLHIVKGFDSARTALEVSSFIFDVNISNLYITYGFNSLEQVKQVDSKDLQKIDILFNPESDGVYSSFGVYNPAHHHQTFVVNYINGNAQKLEDMLRLGSIRGQDYLAAFNGNVNHTFKYLESKSEEKVSPDAIRYAYEILKINDYDELVSTAKEIYTVQNEIYRHKFSTKEEFLEFSEDYHSTLDDFAEITLKLPNERGRIEGFNYNIVKKFQGDLRFFKEDFSIHDVKKVEKIESVMSFYEYDDLQLTDRANTIPFLIDEGYTREEMKEAFTGKFHADGNKIVRLYKESENKESLFKLILTDS